MSRVPPHPPAAPARRWAIVAALVAVFLGLLAPTADAAGAVANAGQTQHSQVQKHAKKHVAKKHKPKKHKHRTSKAKKAAAKRAAAKKAAAKKAAAKKAAAKKAAAKKAAEALAQANNPVTTAPVVVPPYVAPDPSLVATKPLVGFLNPVGEWTRDLTAAPVADNSAGMVANLAEQVRIRYGGVAAFNWYQYNDAFYSVPPTTPRVTMIWDNCQNKSVNQPQLFDETRGAAFANVPIPADAQAAAGTDGALSIWSAATDQFWEFWKAKKQADGWHACWGGRIDHWSTSKGFFADGMGVSASGLGVAPGALGIQEMRAGRIDHAMNLAVVDVAHWSDFSYPAQRSDGTQLRGTPDAIPEGQRFRLDPTVDVASLHLTPMAATVARAAQKYGFIVTDKAGSVGVGTESGAGVVASGGTNPWTALLGGVPGYSIMKNFPWDKLQAMPRNYGQ